MKLYSKRVDLTIHDPYNLNMNILWIQYQNEQVNQVRVMFSISSIIRL